MPSSLYTLNPEDVTTQRPSSSQEQSVNEIVIEQAPIQAGRVGEFNARGRTLKSTLHPLLLQGKAWVSERDINNLAQASFMGNSQSVLPEELLLYSFELPRHSLSPSRVQFMEECAIVFEELQETHTQYNVPGYLNRFSKLYESHFEALCNALDSELNHDPPNAIELEEEVTNLSSATTLMHLTQTIYFQPNPSAIMAEDLMHWVNRLDSRPDPAEGEEIMRKVPASHHPGYWNFLHKAASRGLFKVAISCLKSGGLVDYDGVDRILLGNIIQLLNDCPIGKQSQLARKANELWELRQSWGEWHSKLQRIQIASIRNENARTGLGTLLRILRGDRETIADISDSWQEYVASIAFFLVPFQLTTYKDVGPLYEEAMNFGFNIDKTLPSEIASSALFTSDLPRALVNFFKTDVALAVHLSDLLSKSGALDEFDLGETMTLRDRFILDYGDLALTHPHLAYTAFTYWKSVPPHGIWRLQDAIIRVPLDSQDQVDQFIDLCFDLNLESEAGYIAQAWARRLEQENQVGSALLYFEKGQSYVDIERVCWDHFERLLLAGGNYPGLDPTLVEILENSPATAMVGTLIAPLAVLFAFFKLKQTGDDGAAIQYLSKLFRLSSMPREYVALLIAEMLPLLDGRRATTIGRKDLFEILAAVEDYISTNESFQKGSDLLVRAFQANDAENIESLFRNWRDLMPPNCSPTDIVGLFRVKVTGIIAHLYTTN